MVASGSKVKYLDVSSRLFRDPVSRESSSLGFQGSHHGNSECDPDSFSDGGRFVDPVAAVDQAQKMIAEGVDIIDIGGESTRPGVSYIDEEEEIARIRPIVEAWESTDIPLSIDTRKAAVAQVALDLGADIVNDVSALQDDSRMAQVIQESGAGVVLMHRQGHSATMQEAPHYEDVVGEVKSFLAKRVAMAQSMGIPPDHIIIDPGIGFGKTCNHNLKILANLGQNFFN